MQLRFRYTDDELAYSRRINRLSWIPKWKSLGLALLCLLPSVGLIALTASFIAIMGFIAVASYLIVAISVALLKQPSPSDNFDHTLTLTPNLFRETHSHSEYELNWRRFDEFIENEDCFLLRRLDRFTVLPKRIFAPDEIAQVRDFASNMSETGTRSDLKPVPLYEKLFRSSQDSPIFQFQYQPDDLLQAAMDPLVILDTTSMSATPSKRAGTRLAAVWIGLFVLVSVFLLRPEGSSSMRWTPTQYFLLVSALLLPFGLLLAANRFLRVRAAKRLPQVPMDENQLVLLTSGFAIGNPDNVSFFDWRDIDAFYENHACYGFKSFNELVQVIPKRVFADEAESSAFLNRAVSFHREHRRSFSAGQAAIETGNPYQPPIN